jgi:hypothetical protein
MEPTNLYERIGPQSYRSRWVPAPSPAGQIST